MIRILHEVVQPCVPAFAVVGVVAGKQVEGWRDRDVANFSAIERIGFHFRSIGSNSNNATTLQSEMRAVGPFGIGHAEVAHGHIEPAVDAHAHTVGGVVGTARMFDAPAEAFHQDFFFIGYAIEVLVDESGKERGVDDVKSVAEKMPAAWGMKDRNKVLEFIRLAIVVRIATADHLTIALDVAERAIGVGGNVDISIRGR